MPFKKIGLCEELVQGILATGYTAPTEIQAEAIPVAIAGQDMIACAQTGTGKTAAFVLPILNRLSTTGERAKRPKVRSLILTPTRELAMQIEASVKGYGRFTKMKSVAIFGGMPIYKQTNALRNGVDIVVATPGRLIDHVNRGNIKFSDVEVLVLDEADRMLDMGFINDIKKIIAKMPTNRQTLLFSATMSKEVKALTKNIQRSPKMIQIGEQHNPIDTITQHIYPVAKEQKTDLLMHMIKSQNMHSILVFSRTKHGADKICRKLNKEDIKAEAIHSDRTQKQRLRALEGFKSGKYQVMVATDIAARGINVEGISHVFNFDVPGFPEDYVHRIGRTGRATATGDAITFVSNDEMMDLRKIERFIDRKFEAEYDGDFYYHGRIALNRSSGGFGKSSGKSSRRSSGKSSGKPSGRYSSNKGESKKPSDRKPRAKKNKPGSSQRKRAKAKNSEKGDSSTGKKTNTSSKKRYGPKSNNKNSSAGAKSFKKTKRKRSE